jgi:hypothetical protein
MTAVDATSTSVTVNTDLSITGKVAQFGRGAMADISDKLLGQFVENLNTMILSGGDTSAPAAAPASEPTPAADSSESAAPSPAQEAPTGVRKIDAPEAEALDVLALGGSTIIKMALPIVVIAAAVIWLIVK